MIMEYYGYEILKNIDIECRDSMEIFKHRSYMVLYTGLTMCIALAAPSIILTVGQEKSMLFQLNLE